MFRTILGVLAWLSLALTLWQWLVARRFPLHRRVNERLPSPGPQTGTPTAQLGETQAVTLLKSLKGCDEATEACLRSWFAQDYPGRVQILFGVASPEDPVCGVVRRLIEEFKHADAQLLVCDARLGANAKVSKLVALERLAKHDIIVISDADVLVAPDFLVNVVAPLCFVRDLSIPDSPGSGHENGSKSNAKAVEGGEIKSPGNGCGLVTCFYRLANPTTLALHWEAVTINADFWSQVLQSQSLKPIDFALGAVMATRRQRLKEIGGLESLVNCLADDYQLGHRIARSGHGIALASVVAECWSGSMGWIGVWKHQLRWARTIRVCQPIPYFFSILHNPTFWPWLWVIADPRWFPMAFAAGCGVARMAMALDLQALLAKGSSSAKPSVFHRSMLFWLPLLKDVLQVVVWLFAFAGNTIEWRGSRMRLRSDGTLVRAKSP